MCFHEYLVFSYLFYCFGLKCLFDPIDSYIYKEGFTIFPVITIKNYLTLTKNTQIVDSILRAFFSLESVNY